MVTLDTSFFTLVIIFMFLLILEQIYSIWSCQERWQSINNPRYLTLEEWSRGWPAKTKGRWRLEFNFCLGWKIMYFVLVKFNVNLFAQSQSYILGSSMLICNNYSTSVIITVLLFNFCVLCMSRSSCNWNKIFSVPFFFNFNFLWWMILWFTRPELYR